MSEFWKSTPKYWCKHCSTYVKDTSFERKQHESTAKHQGNLKRFLRDIQNNHERGEREKERAKVEVDRLKGVAGASSTTPTPRNPDHHPKSAASGSLSVADQKRQWAQLAEMGIKVPEQFRPEMAMTGDWQMVAQQVVDESSSETPLSVGVKKRKHEGQEDEAEETGDLISRRGWGTTSRRYPGSDRAELDDLLSSSVSLKKSKSKSVLLKSQTFDEEHQSLLKAQNDATHVGDPAESKSMSPTTDDGPLDSHDITQNPLIKGEKDSTTQSGKLETIPDEDPIPVFKKRKAKAS